MAPKARLIAQEAWQAMSCTYWVERILGLVGVRPSDSLSPPLVKAPWLLCPVSAELNPDESRGLYKAVRRHILGHDAPEGFAVRENLRRLSPRESVPLLYAMRLVARNYASEYAYWPSFHEHILDRELSLNYVRTMVAPELSRLWMQFHQFTKGALYFPREGRVNIKWPIAHAGLVAADLDESRDPLRAFGLEILAEWDESQGAFPALLEAEVQDFYLAFSSWLRQSPELAREHVGKLILSENQGLALTIAELCQLWLRQNIGELRESGSRSKLHERRPSLRAYLRLVAGAGRVTLVVAGGPIPGNSECRLVWKGRDVLFDSRYEPGTKETILYPRAIELDRPQWEPILTYRFSNQQDAKEINIPRSPFPPSGSKGVLLFDADDGRQTRSWKVGQSYYLIAPKRLLSEPWLGDLFEAATPIGQPGNGWEGFETIWGRAKDPLKGVAPENRIERLESLSRTLEAAEAAFTLPGLTELLRPTIRPVGAVLSQGQAIETFDPKDQVWFEIRDAASRHISLELSRWEPESLEYRVLEATHIGTQANVPVIVEPEWQAHPAKGRDRYLIACEGASLQFGFSAPQQAPSSLFELSMSFEMPGSREPSRERMARPLLGKGRLRIDVWPGAPVILESMAKGVTKRRLLYADEVGRCYQAGSEFEHLPGAIEFRAKSWGLQAGPLLFADENCVLEGDWKVHRGPDSIKLSARISGPITTRSVRVAAIGRCPWRGEFSEVDSPIQSAGTVEATINVQGFAPYWVEIASRVQSGSAVIPWFIGPVPSSEPEPNYSFADLEGEGWDQWLPWAKGVEGIARPASMDGLLRASRLGSWIRIHRSLTLTRAWVPLPFGRSNLTAGASVGSVAAFSMTRDLPIKPGEICAPGAPAIHPAAAAGSSISAYLESGESRITVRLSEDEYGWSIRGDDGQLAVCMECGLIYPGFASWQAHSPYAKAVSLVAPGRQISCQLAVLWNPKQVAAALVRFLIQGYRGEIPLPENAAERALIERVGQILASARGTLNGSVETVFERAGDLAQIAISWLEQSNINERRGAERLGETARERDLMARASRLLSPGPSTSIAEALLEEVAKRAMRQ